MAGALAMAGPAWADDAAERDARARFDEGIARVRAHNFEGALLSFRQAYAVTPTGPVVWNLALVEQKTDHPVDALGHFREFLRGASPGEADRAAAQHHIDELNALTGHIDVAAPAGATIAVDGAAAAGPAPLAGPLDVMPGHHALEARLGAKSKVLEADVTAGQTVPLDFRGMSAAPSPSAGSTAPQADATPPGPEHPPAADRPAPGAIPAAKWITVASVGGLGVFSMILGAGFGVASSHDANTAAGLRNQVSSCSGAAASSGTCQQLASNVSAQRTDHGLSTGFWVGGAVLAAGAVGLWFAWPSSASVSTASTASTASTTVKGSSFAAASTGGVRVAPAAGPNEVGFVALGSF